MKEYEQRILMERLARQMELSGSEPLQQQLQAKYRELLGVSLENLDKMHDVEDEEEQMFQKQIQARRKGLELPEILPLKNPYHEEYRPTENKPRDVETLEGRWLLDHNFGRTVEWIKEQDENQYSKIPEQSISRTSTRPSSPTSPTFLDKAKGMVQ
ncbi:20350_t:CDS:1, partial [Racocetra persica]